MTNTNSTKLEKKVITLNQVFTAVTFEVDFSAHIHDYYEIIITMENNYIHTVNNVSFRPNNGDTVFMRPGDVHSAKHTDNTTTHVLRDIYVSAELFRSVCDSLDRHLFNKINSMAAPPMCRLSPETLASIDEKLAYPLFLVSSALEPEVEKQVDILKKVIVTELLGYWLRENLRNENKMPECVARLINAIQEPRFRQLTIDEMATELGYSHAYISRQFHQYFGKTIERYMIDERVEKSIPMLLQTNAEIRDIAKTFGWTKADNYNRAFMKLYGMMPSKYRLLHNEK